MKQTNKFLLYTLKYVSITLSIPFILSTTITSFFCFLFEEVKIWCDNKIKGYE